MQWGLHQENSKMQRYKQHIKKTKSWCRVRSHLNRVLSVMLIERQNSFSNGLHLTHGKPDLILGTILFSRFRPFFLLLFSFTYLPSETSSLPDVLSSKPSEWLYPLYCLVFFVSHPSVPYIYLFISYIWKAVTNIPIWSHSKEHKKLVFLPLACWVRKLIFCILCNKCKCWLCDRLEMSYLNWWELGE